MTIHLLTEKEAMRAWGLFCDGKDTLQIASIMGVLEAEVYNSLYRLRELYRDRMERRNGTS